MTAMSCGMPPSVFFALPEVDQAMMIAHSRIDRLLENHRAKVAREVSDKGLGKGGEDHSYDWFTGG